VSPGARWRRAFHVGPTQAVREALAAALGMKVDGGAPPDPTAGDLIAVEASAHGPMVPFDNAFLACRAWKERAAVTVYVVLSPDDAWGPGLARFCLADGHLVWDPARGLKGAEELGGSRSRGRRASVDDLLRKMEAAMAANENRAVSALQRLLHWERQDTLVERLQDPETGLFDGPYASLKLDEEVKRSQRMHLPLSLILLHIGLEPEQLPSQGPERRELLAEVAAVFLNECRDIDVLSRFTETTFLFLLPGTGPDGARRLAGRMIQQLASRQFGPGIALDPRAGIASIPATGIADRRAFVAVAESCLDRARAGGGDGGACVSWE
jgi:hypothetical protein